MKTVRIDEFQEYNKCVRGIYKTFIAIIILLPVLSLAEVIVSVSPSPVQQGEPALIQISGATLDEIAKIYWDKKSLWFFNYNSVPTALFGIDLNAVSGRHTITLKMEDGSIIEKTVDVAAREKIEAPLGIPEKLGGNTEQAATNLVNNLTKENNVLNNVFSAAKKYWPQGFRYPLASSTVTDSYGYLRKTGYYDIPHKGTDFRAQEGTRVYAINSGVIRLSRTFTVYGKTVAIDHGLGVVSYYMHLSKLYYKEGQKVSKGDIIGLSGSTGYAESPHLHLSIKINGISIDPDAFLKLFN
jgi:murein DD-endopeptidase MepM/ murein hydrolase activator NlpD